jgi:membrane protease YdiL (CAAX protease family)
MGGNSGSRPWWDGDYVWRPTEDVSVGESELVRPLQQSPCPRCGRGVVEDETTCPFCNAVLASEKLRPAVTRPWLNGVMPMLWFFVALLGVSLLQGVAMISLSRTGDLTPSMFLGLTLMVEGIDTMLVVLAVYILPRPPAPPRVEPLLQGLTWCFAAPLLLVMLGINYAYHSLLQHFLGGGGGEVSLGLDPWSPLLLLIVCVQPAIVEELFFRHLALGLLRRKLGIHGGVLVSSVMFAIAHLNVPPSMPVFGLLGMGLGYVRIYSRHMALPMLMHFLHNLAALYLMTQ